MHLPLLVVQFGADDLDRLLLGGLDEEPALKLHLFVQLHWLVVVFDVLLEELGAEELRGGGPVFLGLQAADDEVLQLLVLDQFEALG